MPAHNPTLYRQKYYQAHKEKSAKQSHLWYIHNKKRAALNNKRWISSHKDQVLEQSRATYNKRRSLINDYKSKPCADCGIKYPPYVMDFDHRDPATKTFVIGQGRQKELLKVLSEISKCDVVCSNCHRLRTYRRKYDK